MNLFNRLRIRFTSPMNSDSEWFQTHFLYKVGDVVRLRTTQTVGYGDKIHELLIVCIERFGIRNSAHYFCLRLETGEVMHHYKWNLEHHFKRVCRSVRLTDVMSLEEGLTHSHEQVRMLAREAV